MRIVNLISIIWRQNVPCSTVTRSCSDSANFCYVKVDTNLLSDGWPATEVRSPGERTWRKSTHQVWKGEGGPINFRLGGILHNKGDLSLHVHILSSRSSSRRRSRWGTRLRLRCTGCGRTSTAGASARARAAAPTAAAFPGCGCGCGSPSSALRRGGRGSIACRL